MLADTSKTYRFRRLTISGWAARPADRLAGRRARLQPTRASARQQGPRLLQDGPHPLWRHGCRRSGWDLIHM